MIISFRHISLVRRNPGFTLVELLVAIAIFSVISIMLLGGFHSMTTGKSSIERTSERIKALQFTFLHMGRDLRQLIPRYVRDEFGTQQDPLVSAETGKYILELSRGGYPNPGGMLKRSNIQRVAYGIEDGVLYKYTWRTLDRAQGEEPARMKLIGDVDRLQLRYLTSDKEWVESWPPPLTNNAQAEFPLVVEVMLELRDWNRVTRLFEMPVASL